MAATLALSTAPALAAYTAQISGDTLNGTGNSAPDAPALRLAPGDPGTVQLDVGDDGTADFAFPRSAFRTVDVRAGGGNDVVDGDGGENSLRFVGSNAGEQIDLSADGANARRFRNVGAVTTELADIDAVAAQTRSRARTRASTRWRCTRSTAATR